MRSDTCPGERPVSQKPAPVTVVPGSRHRAKVAPAGEGGERPGVTLVTARGEHGHPLAVPRGTPGTAPGTGTAPAPHVSPGLPAPVPGVPNRRSGKRPRLLAPTAHTAGTRSLVGAGAPEWPNTPPQKHPRPLSPAGPGQEGVKLESRNSPLRASPGPPLPPPQRKGPRAAAPAGRLSRAGCAPHPLPAPRHHRAPRTFPQPEASQGTPRLSRGTPHLFPGHIAAVPRPGAPPGTPHLSPGHPHPQASRAPSGDIPHSLPGPGHPHPRAPRTPTPAQGTPHPSPGHGRTPQPRGHHWVGGWRGAPAAPRDAEPRIGRSGGARPGYPTGAGLRGATPGRVAREVMWGLT